ncbi:branched-chain amino acid ABC transporter permease [Aeromicrobium piscarium]|uniref:Branched-chain amino acid ABC transporter permease n=1 Tax=Aeromicrobium piscarium TaxID=2590901 RepID=A0A554SFM4_9ACTN|nr:branched-chain amino acid ABC transporter permease [Aeromicrobium piscarium]TSD65148.1 branched-chain amino acid ABC transporter permease [Aeromicrobium piscarium]
MTTLVKRHASALGLVAVVALLLIVFSDDGVVLGRLTTIAVIGLIALSVGMGWGQVGILSLCQAQFAAVGAYVTAILSVQYDWPVLLTVVPAAVLPMLVAAVFGRFLVGLSALTLGIATFVLARLAHIAITNGGELTGGFLGISGVPRVDFAQSQLEFAFLSWACVLIVLVLYKNLMDSAFGRALRTIRHDPLRAEADGIRIETLQTKAFALTAGVAGTAGWLYAQFLSYIGPDSLGIALGISVVLMAIVGGAQSIVGPLIGAAVLISVGDYIPVESARGMVYGGALILMFLLAPGGLAAFAGFAGTELRRRRRHRADRSPAPEGQEAVSWH